MSREDFDEDPDEDWPLREILKARIRSIKERARDAFHWSTSDEANARQIEASAPVTPYVPAGRRARNVPPDVEERLQTQMASQATSRPQLWLWPGRIPLGALTLILGEQGIGKSLMALDLAARVSSGQTFPDELPLVLPGATTPETPDGAPAIPAARWPGSDPDMSRIPVPILERMGPVALISEEDDYFATSTQCLDRMGANRRLVMLLHDIHGLRTEHERAHARSIRLPHDLYRLEYLLGAGFRRQTLLIDSLPTFTDLDMRGAKARELYLALAAMARRTSSAVICFQPAPACLTLSNFRMVLASSMSAARSIWCLLRDPQDADRRIFMPVKMNLGPLPSPLAFRTEHQQIVWEPCTGSGAAPAGMRAAAPAVGAPGKSTAQDKTRRWLRDVLSAGPRTAAELNRLAAECHVTPTALRNAKRALGVRIWRERLNDRQVYYFELKSPDA